LVPGHSDIVGRWSEDHGHTADLGHDTVLEFAADGSLLIVAPAERISGRWEMPAPGSLVLIVSGNRLGPFAVAVERENLPLGEFAVLTSQVGLLPFDRRRFTRLDGPA
jgi:hypothetical protein